MKQLNSRAIATQILFELFENKKSLSETIDIHCVNLNEKDTALVREICFGVARFKPYLEDILKELLQKQLKGKKYLAHILLLTALYQIIFLRVKNFAAVNESLNAAAQLKMTPLKGLLNGVLRNFLRNQEQILQKTDKKPQTNHPDWIVNRLKKDYPNWREIINANLQKPPMWIRVNTAKISKEEYAQKIAHLVQNNEKMLPLDMPKSAILLNKAVNVRELFAFDEGFASVQDLNTQRAAYFLNPQDNDVILDACAAPGGKTCHILELAPKSKVYALDLHQERLNKVQENLDRLGQQARLICADASSDEWNKEQIMFDKILLDVPCSATGVIRRHSDIKWLREENDIDNLAALQLEILQNNWKMLKEGGTLLYSTCSVFKQENQEQIEKFLVMQKDAQLLPLDYAGEKHQMLQFLPRENAGDGFFYALLQKTKG